MSIKRTAFSLTLALIAVWTTACGADRGTARSTSGTAPQPVARKVLTFATQVEPTAFIAEVRGGADSVSRPEVQSVFHDSLAVEIEYEVFAPQLGVEVPSIDRGTWRLNADGTMDTIWRLRPNVRWHDGHPFTSADLLFTFQLNQDPEVADKAHGARVGRYMESATAPDPVTFTIHWNAPYLTAFKEPPGDVLPRHLLEDLYLNDKSALGDSRFFTTEFVGLGPYRLVNWERGSHMEAARFDDYYQGRPPLDTVFVRFVSDPNTAIANILSQTVDLVLSHSSEGLDLDAAFEVKRRWEGSGNQVVTNLTGRVYVAQVQYRPDYSRPRNAMAQLPVRQALYYAVDRSTLAEVMAHGLAPSADSYVLPIDPRRPEFDSWIPQYPYDAGRAERLLAEAGWVRGQDGILAHRESGERFEMEIWARQGSGNDKMIAVIADGWKAIGAAMTQYVIPTAMRGNLEFEATRPGFLIINPSGTAYLTNDLTHSREVPTAAGRWRGNNYGGYLNPRVDSLLDQLHVTIDPRQRLPLEQQLVREHMADVAMLPLYWQVVPILMLKGVTGPRARYKSPTANILEWDKD